MSCLIESETAVNDSSHSTSLAAETGLTTKAKRVLVADDQPDVLHAIALLLKPSRRHALLALPRVVRALLARPSAPSATDPGS